MPKNKHEGDRTMVTNKDEQIAIAKSLSNDRLVSLLQQYTLWTDRNPEDKNLAQIRAILADEVMRRMN